MASTGIAVGAISPFKARGGVNNQPTMLDKKDNQLHKNLEKSLKDQEVEEKIL